MKYFVPASLVLLIVIALLFLVPSSQLMGQCPMAKKNPVVGSDEIKGLQI